MANGQGEATATIRRNLRALVRPRWARICVLSVLVYGLLGYFALPAAIRFEAIRLGSAALGRKVSIGRVSFDPFLLRLEVESVRVNQREGAGNLLELGLLRTRLSWISLIRLHPVIREVLLETPVVHCVRTGANEFNFSDLLQQRAATPAPDSPPTLFSVSNIRLENGLIDFDDRFLNEHHRIEGLRLGIPFIANLPADVQLYVQPELQARIDGSAVRLDGKTRPFSPDLDTAITLKIGQLDLPKLLSYSPFPLPVLLSSGQLSLDLLISFAKSSSAPAMRLSGTVDLAAIQVNDPSGKPLLSLAGLHLAAEDIEPLRSIAHLSEVRIDQPVVELEREPDGSINLARLAGSKTQVANVPAPTAPAATAAPADISVKQLVLKDGSVHFGDLKVSQPFRFALQDIAVNLNDWSLLGKSPGTFSVHAEPVGGGKLDLAGNASLASRRAHVEAAMDGFRVASLQPYLDTALAARLTAGTVGLKAVADADWSDVRPQVQASSGEFDLDDIKLVPLGQKTAAVALSHARAQLAGLDLGKQTVELRAVALNGLSVAAERGADGTISLASMLKSGPAKTAPSTTSVQLPWHWRIAQVSLSESQINLADHVPAQPVLLALGVKKLQFNQLSDKSSEPWPFDVQATLNHNGSLSASGSLIQKPLRISLRLNARKLDVAAFQPYVEQQLNAVIRSASLDMSGNALLSQGSSGIRAHYTGDIALNQMRMLDKLTADPFAGWSKLDFSQVDADYAEGNPSVQIGKVSLAGFNARIILNTDGKLNLDDFLSRNNAPAKSLTRATSETAIPAVTGPSAPAAVVANPLTLLLGGIDLQGGEVNYSDNFIKPNFSARLVDITGTVGALGTATKQPTPLDISASLDGNGPIKVIGTVDPLVKPPQLDVTAHASEIELTNFTSYSTKFTGYPIQKGKLNVDLHYQLQQNTLRANNHLFIDQFTLGDPVAGGSVLHLPIKLALSLLKNSRGEIDVNVPVSGSLDDPQFSIGSVIWLAFANVIEKAVTSPFSLLTSAFGGGEELGYIEFAPGSASLDATAVKKLQTLTSALADHPQVKLDLTPHIDTGPDTAGLRELLFEQQLRQQKIQELADKGIRASPEQAEVAPGEYEHYLAKAYAAAEIKKPRNFIGIAKSLPAAQMKQLMLDAITVTPDELGRLAQARAAAVQNWFGGKLTGSRIYTLATKPETAGSRASTRVDFSLE